MIRSEKLLLSGLSVARDFGVQERPYSQHEIAELITSHGIEYIVAQTDYWVDLGVMARLQSALRSDQFEVVRIIPVVANTTDGVLDRELVIFRNRQPSPETVAPLSIEVPALGRTLQSN